MPVKLIVPLSETFPIRDQIVDGNNGELNGYMF